MRVDKPSLEERISEGAFEPLEAVQVAIEVASVLEEVHASGKPYNALCPENVLLSMDGSSVSLLEVPAGFPVDAASLNTELGELTLLFVAP